MQREHLLRIEAAARSATPREACGLLIGYRNRVDWRVVAVEPSRNLADQHDRFEIDPALLLRLQKQLRGSEHSMIGVYHSHPNGVAAPSAMDLAQAWQVGMIWLISAVRPTEVETCGYLRDEREFVAVPLDIVR